MNGTGTDRGSGWHPTAEALTAYAGGAATGVEADSLEAHLLQCERCRHDLADVVRDAEGLTAVDPVWSAITDRIDHPSPAARSGPWWVKVTFGSPLLCAATACLAAVLLAVPLAVSMVNPTAAVTLLLALAPLAPIAGALLAYRPEVDPAGSMTAATPLATSGLVLTRAAVVTGTAVPVALLAAVLLPARLGLLVGWLLPGLALSLVVLAAGTRVDPTRLAGGLALAWATAVAGAGTRLNHLPLEDMLDQLFVNQLAVQLLFSTLAAAAAAAAFGQRDRMVWSLR